MASSAGAPKMVSLRTIKSDVVVGLGPKGDEIAEKLDETEPGWKISGKYVSRVLALRLWFGINCEAQAIVLLSDGRPGEKVRFA
jgi:hypothetical protein